MIKKIIFLFIIFNFGYSQTTLYGLNGWYNTNTIAVAGETGAVPNSDSYIINPAGIAIMPKQIQLNIIKYPAGISAQSILFVKPLNNSNIGIGLRHLSYGSFKSTNEAGVEDGTYSAGDTWLSAAWARKNKDISLGTTGGIFISNLESYNAAAIVFSTGILYNYSKLNTQLGISISNFGVFITRYTEKKENLPSKVILSANKELAHLPLDINIDFGYALNNKITNWRFGGIFELPYNLRLSLGISSNNLTQRTENNLFDEIFGSSGVGLTYIYNKYSIEIGGYSYGTGGWIYGTGFNIKL
jgi:hypothetical protein